MLLNRAPPNNDIISLITFGDLPNPLIVLRIKTEPWYAGARFACPPSNRLTNRLEVSVADSVEYRLALACSGECDPEFGSQTAAHEVYRTA